MSAYLYRRISYDDKSRVSVSVAMLITSYQPETFLLIVRVFILLLVSSFCLIWNRIIILNQEA